MAKNILLNMNELMAKHFSKALSESSINDLAVQRSVGSIENLKRLIKNYNPDIVLIYIEKLDDFDGNYERIIAKIRDIQYQMPNQLRIGVVMGKNKLTKDLLFEFSTVLGITDIFTTELGSGLDLKSVFTQLDSAPTAMNVSKLATSAPGTINNLEERTVSQKPDQKIRTEDNQNLSNKSEVQPLKIDRRNLKKENVGIVLEKPPKKDRESRQQVVKFDNVPTQDSNEQVSSNAKPLSIEKSDSGLKNLPVPIEKPKKNRGKLKKIGKLVLGVFILFSLILGGIYFLNLKPSYNTLLQKQEYIKAAKLYPDKVNDLENRIVVKREVNSSQIKPLISNSAFNNGTFIKFDRSFLDNNYSQAIVDASALPKGSFKDVHASMLGYAYLKEDNVKLAKVYAKQADDSSLKSKITTVESAEASIKEYEDAVKRNDLTQSNRTKLEAGIEQNKEIIRGI